MNKKYSLFKITIPLLAALVLTGTSCRKYLYQGPITATYGAEFWTSQTSVEQASLAMYGQLRSNLRDANSYFVNGDLITGAFLPAHGQWYLQSITATSSKPYNYSYVPYQEHALQNWSRFYQLIAQANLILQNVPQMSSALFTSESVRKNYIAEALFMRAYTYFYITRIWGDPVYVKQTFNDVDYGNIPPIARTPEAIVLDSCLQDLKTAASYLNFTGGDPSKTIRANKGSACALIAHIYAWKHQYDSAHVYCQQVINNGGYALEPMYSYTNIWKGQTSSESIFESAMNYNSNDPNFKSQNSWAEAQYGFFSTFVKGTLINRQTGAAFVTNKNDCWVSPAGGFVNNVYDTTNDSRYKAVFIQVPASGGDGAGYMLLKYTGFTYQQPGSTPQTSSYPYVNNNLVLLRLSDIYLLDAEAQANLNNLGGAAASLAFTENRAGINSYRTPTNQSDMITEIMKERGRELIGEGQWFYDFIRTAAITNGKWFNDAGYFKNGHPERVDALHKGYYWPLDMGTLFPQDNLLTQNPWWAANK